MVSPLGGKRTVRLRVMLRNAYGDFCHWCGKRMIFEPAFRRHDLYATVEHLIERREGGTHDWENLRLAHRKCNTDRSNRPADPNSKRSHKKRVFWERVMRFQEEREKKIPGGRT